MFWYLLLAHFIADYPLQPDWMVRQKKHFKMLLLHVLVHLLVLSLLTATIFSQAFPYLLVICSIHFGIDALKNWFTIHRPHWITIPYIVDQLLHWIVIGGVAAFMNGRVAPGNMPLAQPQVVYLLGFLLVTYVWLITERVIALQRPEQVNQFDRQAWLRMLVRAGFLLVILLGRNSLTVVSASLILPYDFTRRGARKIIIDLAVSLLIACLVIFAMAP